MQKPIYKYASIISLKEHAFLYYIIYMSFLYFCIIQSILIIFVLNKNMHFYTT